MSHTSDTTIKVTSQSLEDVKIAETTSELALDGSLNPSQYIGDIKPDNKTVSNIQDWAAQQKETTRARLAMMLAKCLGGSLIATYLLMGVAAFSPNADKVFIKDLIPLVITPQVTLLGVALGYYFGAKEED